MLQEFIKAHKLGITLALIMHGFPIICQMQMDAQQLDEGLGRAPHAAAEGTSQCLPTLMKFSGKRTGSGQNSGRIIPNDSFSIKLTEKQWQSICAIAVFFKKIILRGTLYETKRV